MCYQESQLLTCASSTGVNLQLSNPFNSQNEEELFTEVGYIFFAEFCWNDPCDSFGSDTAAQILLWLHSSEKVESLTLPLPGFRKGRRTMPYAEAAPRFSSKNQTIKTRGLLTVQHCE